MKYPGAVDQITFGEVTRNHNINFYFIKYATCNCDYLADLKTTFMTRFIDEPKSNDNSLYKTFHLQPCYSEVFI